MPFYLFNWVLNIIYIYIYTYRYIYIFIFIYIYMHIYICGSGWPCKVTNLATGRRNRPNLDQLVVQYTYTNQYCGVTELTAKRERDIYTSVNKICEKVRDPHTIYKNSAQQQNPKDMHFPRTQPSLFHTIYIYKYIYTYIYICNLHIL